MTNLVSKPIHGAVLIDEQRIASTALQNFFDDLELRLNQNVFGNQVAIPSYTVATLPPVPDISTPGLIFVSDETGGSVPAFSDGTDWRRITDRAVVA